MERKGEVGAGTAYRLMAHNGIKKGEGKTTATEDLSELVKLRLLKSSGVKGRGAKYVLK